MLLEGYESDTQEMLYNRQTGTIDTLMEKIKIRPKITYPNIDVLLTTKCFEAGV